MRTLSALLISLRALSFGIWVILILFIVSGFAVALWPPSRTRSDLQMWMFSLEHQAMYMPLLNERENRGEEPVDVTLMSIPAMQSRMMSGFFGGLDTADLIEVERATVGQVFMGPMEAIGFRDLTEELKSSGLEDAFNPPSLAPWSVNGHVFGLPHDVHPVMLAYRADLTEAAGIDITQARTWTEFFDLLRPMMTDADEDGQPDRYAMSLWPTHQDNIELLILQGGGALFSPEGQPTVNAQINADLLAEIVSWSVGPARSVTDIDEFSAAGHQARVEGKAIAYLCPDWMCSVWKMHVPKIGGKMKLMPLPAFKVGGRRTSVRGGTMLGFPKTSRRFDEAWKVGLELYTSPEVARALFEKVDIVTPVKALWDDPIYDRPDPFFMGQAKGRMYLELAPQIPLRTSSPYNQTAVLGVRDAAVNLQQWATRHQVYDKEGLAEEARKLLQIAQETVVREMARNAFANTE